MKKIIQAVGIFLTLALFLSACLPETTAGQEPQQQQEQQVENTPTLDTQSMVNTAVAQTVEAQNQIGTAVALTTVAQNTVAPTVTPFTIPTVTPFIVSTPTTKPGSGVPAKATYACDVVLVRPRAYAEFNRGQDFDIKMTVVNTGTRDWYQGFDLKYSGGTVMTTTTHVELPAMAPGAKHQIVLDAAAPTERGTHTMTWTVEGRICFGYVTITVK